MPPSQEDTRFNRLHSLCLALPETTTYTLGEHTAFQVRAKTFVWHLVDHHGDDVVGINCKVPPGENAALIAAVPERYYMPSYLGPRGWVGLRFDLPKVDWREVTDLVTVSYRLIAPKRLAAQVPPEPK